MCAIMEDGKNCATVKSIFSRRGKEDFCNGEEDCVQKGVVSKETISDGKEDVCGKRNSVQNRVMGK